MESQLHKVTSILTIFLMRKISRKLVIALTKYEQYFIDHSFVSIKWAELIEVLHQTIKSVMDPTNIF